MVSIDRFLNKEGKISIWPSKKEGKDAVLRYLGNLFETGRFYSEKEVNGIIAGNHSFSDFSMLRRELIDHGVLMRTQDGARYWRGGLWPADGKANTKRMLIRPATPEDAQDLSDIYWDCSFVGDIIGMPNSDADLKALLEGSDLPPQGSAEFNYLTVLRELEGGKRVGLAQFYTAWPEPGSVCLGLFLLHSECRGLGYGMEFIEAFTEECKRQNYKRIYIGVALRNQNALKFWVKAGFKCIDKVVCDGESGPGRLGLLGLSKPLL